MRRPTRCPVPPRPVVGPRPVREVGPADLAGPARAGDPRVRRALGVSVLVPLLLAGCAHGTSGAAGGGAAGATGASAVVGAVLAQAADGTVTTTTTGTVVAGATATVTASAPGRVAGDLPEVGDTVREGATVATLADTTGLHAALEAARAATAQARATVRQAEDPPAVAATVTQAEAQVRTAQASLDTARLQRDQAVDALASGTGTQAQVDAAALAVSQADEALTAARQVLAEARDPDPAPSATVAAARAALDAARAQQEQAARAVSALTVRAVRSGTVTSVPVVVGQTLAAGAPVATLAVGAVEVEFTLTDAQAAALRAGERPVVQVRHGDGPYRTAHDLQVDATAGADALVTARVVLPAAVHARLGAAVDVRVRRPAPQGVGLPARAVLVRDGGTVVVLVPGTGSTATTEFARVQVLADLDGGAVAVTGVEAGDRVAVTGQGTVGEGRTVAVVAAMSSTTSTTTSTTGDPS